MKRKMVSRRRDRRTRLTQVWMDGPSPIAAGQGHRHHRHFCCRHQHFYLIYNHRHHQRVSLGLLTRNYTSELQLSGPGPVTQEKQQVLIMMMVIVLIVLMVLMIVMMMMMMVMVMMMMMMMVMILTLRPTRSARASPPGSHSVSQPAAQKHPHSRQKPFCLSCAG